MKLNLDDILEEGSLRMQIVEMAQDFQKLLARLYPGARLEIEIPDHQHNGEMPSIPKFEELPYIEQMRTVLRENKVALATDNLLKNLNERGSRIPKNTLNSYLSRNKDIFFRVGRGEWTLQEFRAEANTTRR